VLVGLIYWARVIMGKGRVEEEMKYDIVFKGGGGYRQFDNVSRLVEQ